MEICEACRRPLIASGPCPFCARRGVTSVGRRVAVGVAAVVLSACYGPPPASPSPLDCADTDATESSSEACSDELDNDCDGLIDVEDPDCPT